MPLTKMQKAALDGDEAEWLRLRQESQQNGNSPVERVLNIPVSYPPVIGNFQKEVIQSYLDEERDQAIIAKQTRRAIADNPTSPLIEGHELHPTRELWPMIWSTGTIRVFFPEKGYGFIKPNCGGLDVWFHIQDRVNKDYFPREGESLTYLTRLGTKGTLVAKQWSELKADVISNDIKGDLSWANDQFERSVCGLDSVKPDLGEDIKKSMYDVMYGKRS